MRVSKITATKEFTWDMAHMLAGHKGLCQNLHGHTYKMEVTIARTDNEVVTEGPSEGMVTDFKNLKAFVNDIIVEPLDHATMINAHTQDPCESGIWAVLANYNKKLVLVPYRPTAENMAQDFITKINECAENNHLLWRVVRLRLYETPTSYAEVEA